MSRRRHCRRRPHLATLVAGVLAAAVTTAAFGACDRDEGASGGSGAGRDDGATSQSVGADEDLVRALCGAAEVAAAGDVERAGAVFADVHTRLHDLASASADGAGEGGTRSEQRAAVARLLEAKERVEADLEGQAPAADLAPHLRALAATVSALVGEPVPTTCA